MKKIIYLVVSILQFMNSYSQEFINPIDSTIACKHLADNDWIIALTITESGRIPIVDSLGNIVDEDPTGTYVFTKINNNCTLQKFEHYFIGDKFAYKISKSINISESIICNYNKDSIQKANNEWIYPNIYRIDSLQVYEIQMNGFHSPSFRLCFRTKQSMVFKQFGEVDVYTSPRIYELFQINHRNLNSDYNSKTFIYRAFMNYITLLRKNFKIRILE